MKLDLRLCALALLPLSLTSTASAQNVYVDLQESTAGNALAPPSYGGGFFRPGIWNEFDPINFSSVTLSHADTGLPTGVSITGSVNNVADEDLSAGVDGPLYHDFANIQASGSFTFSGLALGTYFVVTHGFNPDGTNMQVIVNGGTPRNLQTSAATWPGRIPDETFVTQIASVGTNGTITIQVNNNTTDTLQRITGIQLIVGAPIGGQYCDTAPNSTGMPADMEILGTPDESAEAIGMVISDMPSFSFGFPMFSATQGFVPMAGGCGNLCLANPTIYRWVGQGTSNGGANIFQSDASGTVVQRLNWATPANGGGANVDVDTLFLAGTTWNFQGWYRDGVASGSCTTPGTTVTSNFTNGYTVTWQ